MMVLLFTFSARILCYFNMRPPQKKWVNGEFPCYTPTYLTRVEVPSFWNHFLTFETPSNSCHQESQMNHRDETWESPSMIKVNVFWKPCSKPYGSIMFIIYKSLFTNPPIPWGRCFIFFNLQHSLQFASPDVYTGNPNIHREIPKATPQKKRPGQSVRILRTWIGIRRSRCWCWWPRGQGVFFPPK